MASEGTSRNLRPRPACTERVGIQLGPGSSAEQGWGEVCHGEGARWLSFARVGLLQEAERLLHGVPFHRGWGGIESLSDRGFRPRGMSGGDGALDAFIALQLCDSRLAESSPGLRNPTGACT